MSARYLCGALKTPILRPRFIETKRAWTRMTDPASQEQRRRQVRLALFPCGRMSGLLLVGLGAVSLVSGATGHDALSHLYRHGAVSFNDAIPGAVFLAIGLFFVRVAGGAPLLDQVRAMRDWGTRQWISVALVTLGVLAGLAVAASNPLLSPWMRYSLGGAATLVMIIGTLLWPKGRNAPARS